jgi:hypothetical protein
MSLKITIVNKKIIKKIPRKTFLGKTFLGKSIPWKQLSLQIIFLGKKIP